MANNEIIQSTNTIKYYSYKEAREVDKYINSKPTTYSRGWIDIRTRALVYF